MVGALFRSEFESGLLSIHGVQKQISSIVRTVMHEKVLTFFSRISLHSVIVFDKFATHFDEY
jgi:hypothetical protein